MTTDFDDEAAAGTPVRCRTCHILSDLDASDPKRAAELREAIAGRYPNSVIARVLTKWGFPIGESAVRGHRSRHL